MSTQPGKNKGRTDDPVKEGSGDEPKKTVAASAKPGRDEATAKLPALDETTPDLGTVKDAAAKKPAKAKEPVVKDTAKDAVAEPTLTDVPVAPVKDAAEPSWTKPAEPAGSVSRDRTDKPLGSPPPLSSPPSSGSSPSSSSGSRGFASTVLKDRPVATPAADADKSKPAASGKPARKAQLQLARLEPWSVMKFSFVMSLVCFVVLLVAVVVLYMILAGLGVFDAIGDTVNSLTKRPGESGGGVDAGSWFSFARVFGYTVLVGALNVLLITALSTVGSVIYNLAADLVGGVEVTLKEAD
ncbi:DUF3566 domain-containing protein [Actinomadura macrotermitis]|uniref:DUF3566 domain-containing protein n=1 Tax=Actinomadura macrotermitis TaxID=2585200 RepID=A0A7K0BVR7_9ACTN|nr:hypothetical protein [Actinomadura macrotermitis]